MVERWRTVANASVVTGLPATDAKLYRNSISLTIHLVVLSRDLKLLWGFFFNITSRSLLINFSKHLRSALDTCGLWNNWTTEFLLAWKFLKIFFSSYPRPTKGPIFCQWLIKAPPSDYIEFSIQDLDLDSEKVFQTESCNDVFNIWGSQQITNP